MSDPKTLANATAQGAAAGAVIGAQVAAALPPQQQGYGKVFAAGASGALATILVYVIDQVMAAKGLQPLPPEITAAIQTLVTSVAVFITPHDLGR